MSFYFLLDIAFHIERLHSFETRVQCKKSHVQSSFNGNLNGNKINFNNNSVIKTATIRFYSNLKYRHEYGLV